jgi:hypothetical protein
LVNQLHPGQVDGELVAAAGGVVEGSGEKSDVAQIDLAAGNHPELAVFGPVCVDGERCGHQLILACK